MDAPYYNGDDTREFGPDPDADTCDVCGAAWDQDCTPDCRCESCERRAVEMTRGGEDVR